MTYTVCLTLIISVSVIDHQVNSHLWANTSIAYNLITYLQIWLSGEDILAYKLVVIGKI